MDEETLTELTRPAAAAHLVLLNAIRRSMGRSLEPFDVLPRRHAGPPSGGIR